MNETSSYARYVCAGAALIFTLNLPIYLAIDMHIMSAPYYWALLVALLTLPAIIQRCAHWEMLKSPLLLWCFGFLWITIGGFFISTQSQALWREVLLRVMAIFELVWLYILFTDYGVMKWARMGILCATGINVGLNIYEFFYPMTFSSTYGRSAGFHGNPNQAADALCLGALFTISILPRWGRLPFLLFVGIGVFLTFSRSGMIEWTILAVGASLARDVRLKDVLVTGAVAFGVMVILLVPFSDEILRSWDKLGGTNKDLAERLNFFSNPGEVVDYSALERAYVAKQAWERVADHPFIGQGTGAASEAMVGTHNAYLEFMEDHGVFGGLILPGLILAATWGAASEVRIIAWVFACMFLFQGFFSHGILYAEFRILMIALMAAMVWYNQEAKLVREALSDSIPAHGDETLVSA